MTTKEKLNASQLADLCQYSIVGIKQVIWNMETDEAKLKIQGWGGQTPVISVCFDDPSNSCLLVAATDTSLALRLSQANDFEAVISLVNEIDENDYTVDELVGMFDLDSVVSPVPDWDILSITKMSVITTELNQNIVGICISVNLGIRIGLFVAPNPGITLSFNDSCDLILAQAEKAQRDGLIRIDIEEYPNKETPKQISTIDWFDWLRDKDEIQGVSDVL